MNVLVVMKRNCEVVKLMTRLHYISLRISSNLVGQAKKSNPKLLSRDVDRSPLKYIISIILSFYLSILLKKIWPLD